MKAPSVELKILGQKIAVKSPVADSERMQQVAELVADRIREAEAKVNTGAAPHHVTLLALFYLAEEYLSAKDRAADYFERLERKHSELTSSLEAGSS